jgi:hypothetical protein
MSRLLRSFSWKGVLVFFGFCAALALWTWCGVIFSNKELSFNDHMVYFLELFQRSLLNYFPTYLLVGVADSLPLQGRKRIAALTVALVAGIALAVQARCAVNFNEVYWAYDAVQLPYCTSFPTWSTYFDFPGASIQPLCIAGVVMIFVFSIRRDRELVASLHRVQAEELDARRQRVESEIDMMRARVDPDKLVETLRSVRANYEASIAEGESLLDNLIDDLRRAARAPAGAAAE